MKVQAWEEKLKRHLERQLLEGRECGETVAREKRQMLREKEEPPLKEQEHRTHACAPAQSKSSLRGRERLSSYRRRGSEFRGRVTAWRLATWSPCWSKGSWGEKELEVANYRDVCVCVGGCTSLCSRRRRRALGNRSRGVTAPG